MEGHLFPQPDGNARPMREGGVGQGEGGSAQCGMMYHTQAILSPNLFPMVDAQFLHHCLKTVAQSPAAGTLDTVSVLDVWTGLDDGK